MAQLIFYGILVAVLLGGAVAVRTSIEHKGAEKQKAIDAPLIAAEKQGRQEAEKGRDDALAANGKLQADLKVLEGERAACTAKVDELATSSTRAMNAGQAALAKANAAVASLAEDARIHRALALAQPKPGVTCEQTLTNVDRTLRELATRRLRDHAPGSEGHSGGEGTAADQDPGAGAVRIRP